MQANQRCYFCRELSSSKLSGFCSAQVLIFWYLDVNHNVFCHSHGFMVFSVFVVLCSLFVGSSVFSLHINGSGCTLIFLLKSVSAVCCPLLSSGFQLQSVDVTAQHNLHITWLIKTGLFLKSEFCFQYNWGKKAC